MKGQIVYRVVNSKMHCHLNYDLKNHDHLKLQLILFLLDILYVHVEL